MEVKKLEKLEKLKVVLLAEDKPIIKDYQFLSFLGHENIEYVFEYDASNVLLSIDNTYLIIFFYKKNNIPNESFELLKHFSQKDSSLFESIDLIPNNMIYCFHELDYPHPYTQEEKELCQSLITYLKEKKVKYCSHMFDLMHLLRLEKECINELEKDHIPCDV